MENFLEIRNNYKDEDLKGFSGIYFGDPFCQNLITKKEELTYEYNKIKNLGKKFILNTPFVSDSGIKNFLNNIELLSKIDEDFEIVFNDWGLFYEVRSRFPSIKLLLGRYLTKQKTDPNMKKFIMNEQVSQGSIKPKMIPETLSDYFKQSMINDTCFQDFLIENNVNRVEIEYLVCGMNLKLKECMKASIYYPYAHIAPTRMCGLLYMTYSKCSKICQDIKVKYDTIEEYPYVAIGNTLYYDIENILIKDDLKKYNSIDRVVFNDIDAYYRYINK